MTTKHLQHELAPSGLPVIPRTALGPDAAGVMQYNYDLSALDSWAIEQGYSQHPDMSNPLQVCFTGPYSRGLVQTADGTLYDVTPQHILTKSAEHVHEVGCHLVGLQMEATGQMDTEDAETGRKIKWRHTDCNHCDAPKTMHVDDPRLRTALATGAATAAVHIPIAEAVQRHLAAKAAQAPTAGKDA